MKILLDAGHGAGRTHNRGSVCSNEGDNNFRYSLVLKRELEKIKGVSVDLVRKKITDNPGLSSRARMGNGYDLFLSLHSNAAGASVRGTEIWDNVARPNKSLADKLVAGISKAFGHSNRGTKYRRNSSGGNYYGVLRNNNAKSSMIIEHGFHTNKTDCNFFKNNHTQIARVTTDVIKKHYGLTGGSKPKPVAPKPKPSTGGTSIVNYLNSKGINSSFSNRKKLASQYGISNYKGTASQNLELLKLMRDEKPAKVDINKLANDVIAGKYGTGAERRRRLGSNYSAVQKRVNEILQPKARTLKVGSRVTLNSNAREYATGETIPNRFKNKTYTIQQIKGNRVLLKELYSWVYTKDVR